MTRILRRDIAVVGEEGPPRDGEGGASRWLHPPHRRHRKASGESQDLDVPLWVSEGYQALVFVPSGGTRLDRMSIHMLPIRHT
jgi:hypothetical protein